MCDEGFQQVWQMLLRLQRNYRYYQTLGQNKLEKEKEMAVEYEAQEEAPQDQKQKFKVGFYYAVLDMDIQSVEERFQHLQ